MMKHYLRGFLPVIVDVETGGFNETTDALLEIAAVFVGIDRQRMLYPQDSVCLAVHPFPGSNIEQSALDVNRIDILDPKRNAQPEKETLKMLFEKVRAMLEQAECTRAILAGHNAQFDLKFLNAATRRNKLKNNPFHSFSVIDTATLGAMAYGQTVLSKIAEASGIEWDSDQAHSAEYDARITARILCNIFNRWRQFAARET